MSDSDLSVLHPRASGLIHVFGSNMVSTKQLWCAGSSRSHCLLQLHVVRTSADGQQRYSKLCLVDLAGSERQDKVSNELLLRGCAPGLLRAYSTLTCDL